MKPLRFLGDSRSRLRDFSPDAIYVLHAFKKKTQAIAKRDIDLAKARFDELMRTIK